MAHRKHQYNKTSAASFVFSCVQAAVIAEETSQSISEEALASLDAAQEKVWRVEEKVERVLMEAMEGGYKVGYVHLSPACLWFLFYAVGRTLLAYPRA